MRTCPKTFALLFRTAMLPNCSWCIRCGLAVVSKTFGEITSRNRPWKFVGQEKPTNFYSRSLVEGRQVVEIVVKDRLEIRPPVLELAVHRPSRVFAGRLAAGDGGLSRRSVRPAAGSRRPGHARRRRAGRRCRFCRGRGQPRGQLQRRRRGWQDRAIARRRPPADNFEMWPALHAASRLERPFAEADQGQRRRAASIPMVSIASSR